MPRRLKGMSPKPRNPPRTSDDYCRTARLYCHWLAQRDGIEVEHDGGKVHYDGRFIQAVDMGNLCILIPHHNWVPTLKASHVAEEVKPPRDTAPALPTAVIIALSHYHQRKAK